jgi:hypothetical protein
VPGADVGQRPTSTEARAEAAGMLAEPARLSKHGP